MTMRSVLLFVLASLCLLSVVRADPTVDAAVMSAPQVDDVTLLQLDAQAHTTNSEVSALESELAAALAEQNKLAAELEAQTHADTAAATAATTNVDTEATLQVEHEHAADADAEAELDADSEVDADTDAELEADSELDADSEVDLEKEFEAHAAAEVSSSASATTEAAATAAAAAPPKPRQRYWPNSKLKITRSAPELSPDVVQFPNGKKLFKSWVVNPNLVPETPKAKVQPRHSKERTLSASEGARLARFAKLKPSKSEIRREFERKNPQAAKKNEYGYSPSEFFELLYKQGAFPQLKFDKPTTVRGQSGTISHRAVKRALHRAKRAAAKKAFAAAVGAGKPGSVTSTAHVTQHLTIRHHAPSVRQRAEVAALRAAARTLRRINNKRHEFKTGLRQLRRARRLIQQQIHQHHVRRALVAKKIADRAARRAAWSSLLQHRRLRKSLFRKIAKALRKGHLSGEARKQAIAALIKQNISPKERKRLHKFIKGHLRNRRRNRRRAAKKGKKGKQGKKGKKGSKKGGKKSKQSKTTPIVGATKTTAAASATTTKARFAEVQPSQKDQEAIDRLVERIKAAAQPSSEHHHAAKKVEHQPRFAEVSAAAELAQAEALAAQAEAEAVTQLGVETEVDAKDDLLLQTEAQVEAATSTTDDFLHQHGVYL